MFQVSVTTTSVTANCEVKKGKRKKEIARQQMFAGNKTKVPETQWTSQHNCRCIKQTLSIYNKYSTFTFNLTSLFTLTHVMDMDCPCPFHLSHKLHIILHKSVNLAFYSDHSFTKFIIIHLFTLQSLLLLFTKSIKALMTAQNLRSFRKTNARIRHLKETSTLKTPDESCITGFILLIAIPLFCT